jgi:hypothetical protein
MTTERQDVELFPDLSTLADSDLVRLIAELEHAEEEISRRRSMLHGRIDILRAERVERIKARVSGGDVKFEVPEKLEHPIFTGTGDLPEEGELEPMPDLATISEDELRAMIDELEHEEDDVSLERRVIHGRIDILRAERARRKRGGNWDPDRLADVLAHGADASNGDEAA